MNQIKKHPIASFYILSLLIGLAIIVPSFLSAYKFISFEVPSFLFLIAASSASISAIIITGILYKKKGLLDLLKKLTTWKINPKWYLFAIFINFIIVAAALGIYTIFGGTFPDLLKNISSLIPILIILTIQAGLGEEIGWRGFATPKLQKKFSGITACLITGILWSIWHLPLYFLPGSFQNIMYNQIGILGFLLYTLFITASSFVYTWAYNKTKSLIIPILLHGSLNAATWFFSASEISTVGFLPLTFLTLLQVIVAILIIIFSGKNLSRNNEIEAH